MVVMSEFVVVIVAVWLSQHHHHRRLTYPLPFPANAANHICQSSRGWYLKREGG